MTWRRNSVDLVWQVVSFSCSTQRGRRVCSRAALPFVPPHGLSPRSLARLGSATVALSRRVLGTRCHCTSGRMLRSSCCLATLVHTGRFVTHAGPHRTVLSDGRWRRCGPPSYRQAIDVGGHPPLNRLTGVCFIRSFQRPNVARRALSWCWLARGNILPFAEHVPERYNRKSHRCGKRCHPLLGGGRLEGEMLGLRLRHARRLDADLDHDGVCEVP